MLEIFGQPAHKSKPTNQLNVKVSIPMPSKKATKKVATKKAPVKKAAAKKAPAKKTVTKKVAAKKAAPAKVPAKKAPVKKAAAKKAPVKKAPVKKAAAKKAPVKKISKTSITAQVDVGFGNNLYVRGEGAGLSWETGIAMENTGPYDWVFESKDAKGEITFKFLVNDEIWAEGENITVEAGSSSISSPVFP